MAFQKLRSKEDNAALTYWDEYYKNLSNIEVVDRFESEEIKTARKKKLEADPEAWFKYYFSKYCTSEPAQFHKDSTRRVLNNMEWYEVRAWSRELAKSSRAMMELLYLTLTGKKKMVFLISANKDSAVRLLRPFKLAFEKNQRIINDYGVQENYGSWAEDQFTTKSGAMFIAVGAGQSPRGAKNEEYRPDAALIDDFDTDEACRNPDIIDNNWNWLEQAVYGTRSISGSMWLLFLGNIIADDCCIKRAMKIADKYTIVNIRDENGKSSWPNKNSEEMIDRVLSKISAASAQKEYFNNPIVLGKVFPKLNFGKMQPINKYKFVVQYTDPSYKKNGDFKASCIVGKWKDEYHVLWMRCRQTSVAEMIDWHFEGMKFTNGKSAHYHLIEYPWIDDTLKREIKKANKRHNITLALKADERKKPEKFFRIESNLEPLNRNGKLIFNEDMKETPDMKEVEFQFLALSPKSRAHDDAPDDVEGAVWVVNHKNLESAPPLIIQAKNRKNRY